MKAPYAERGVSGGELLNSEIGERVIQMKPKNLIVFDMDGVIVDVSASYRDVVRRTTQLFFHPARASESLPEPLFALSDLAAVKQSGGLNNDWDLTFAAGCGPPDDPTVFSPGAGIGKPAGTSFRAVRSRGGQAQRRVE